MQTRLDSDIQFLPGVGPKKAELLKKELGINTIEDLLRTYPFRYIDRSSIMRICDLRPNMAYVQFRAKILRVTLYSSSNTEPLDPSKPINFKTVRRMVVWVSDGTGEMETVFFKGVKWMFEKLKPGLEFIFFGKPSEFNGKINIVHPEVDSLASQSHLLQQSSSNNPATQQTKGNMTGVYPSTEKLKSAGVTAKAFSKLIASAINLTINDIPETLPEYLIRQKGLPSAKTALEEIHFPKDMRSLELAKYRIKFEELFLLQTSLLKQKYIRSRSEIGIKMPKVGEAFNACYNALPFPLTGAQKRVITEIRDDMKSGHQMNRLLQGDVGSGKTMVAVLTALIAVGNGFQACIMAPTEVLAQQHYKNISKYLSPTSARAALLTGSSKTAERREVHAGIEDGSIHILVGTHALIEDNVIFKNLGLAVIDEQHRFGVEQRAKLWKKTSIGIPPHVLVMTATPIPRTLAMTLYGDLDVSVIDELPPGRKPVQTIHGTEAKRPALFKFMKDQIALGRQIFVVYPLIFESEKMDYKNLEQGFEQIVQNFPFPPYKTAIVHGKQSNEEKKFNMDAFAAGRADILVATSVIEVGVDVPNASVMVIESAERFGLSQLHQLRGRVGRGSERSFCVLMTDYKMSKESRHRIELMCRTENGFELAEEDMKMRGPGDLEGTQQSGLPVNLNLASLSSDGLLLNEARVCASAVLDKDPELALPENAPIAAELRKNKYKVKDYSKIS
jgi:ATP-dependent DNA helicase RecG